MKEPLITVAMPVYNAGKFLQLALSSIINQTYQNWELIILDDGSTDGCFDGLSGLNDKRVRLIRDGENKGIAIRLNQAINLAKGEFFARMDADDISKPERLEHQLNQLLNQSKLDLVASKVSTINLEGKVIGSLPFKYTHKEICAKPWLGFYMPHPSWMGRTAWFKQHLYAIPAPYLCEDQELLLRTYSTSNFLALDEALLMYRVHSNKAFKKLLKTRCALFKVQYKHFLKNSNYIFLILAFISFLFRILKDSIKTLVERYRF